MCKHKHKCNSDCFSLPFPLTWDQNGNGNSQSNSGLVWRSQFIDGGLGDVANVWRNVKLKKSNVVINHNSINFNVTGNGNIMKFDGEKLNNLSEGFSVCKHGRMRRIKSTKHSYRR